MKKWNKPEMMDLDTKCTTDGLSLSGPNTPSVPTPDPTPDPTPEMVTCPGCGKSIFKSDFHNPANHNSALEGGGSCPYKKGCAGAGCPCGA